MIRKIFCLLLIAASGFICFIEVPDFLPLFIVGLIGAKFL